MYHVTVGSDTYGRVKKVGSTPIVTRFGMVSSLPVVPLESFYFERLGDSTSKGIPFLVQIRSTTIEGIPLARLDMLSVAMTYARGLFGTMAIMGFVGTFMVFMMWVTGERLDETATIMAKCVATCFAIGTVAGLCTYVVPFQMTTREREIRRLCGTILGISADPARVRCDFARAIESFLNGSEIAPGMLELAHELARTRLRIALGEPQTALEDHTDDILERIRIHVSTSA